jgi:hypothetical protein
MSSSKPVKKKIVVTTQQESKAKPRATKRSNSDDQPVEMLFKRKNYILVGVGIVLIALGFLLMSGGHMPSPEVWDESIIYSPRRTIVAPIVILGGLGVVLYSIFKK